MTVEGTFMRAFLCPRMCRDAFRHTTKVVGLDACNMWGPFGGVILVVTILDGNGQVFPGAIAVAEGENRDSWVWFVTLMRAAFEMGDGAGVVVLSNREKGLLNSVSEVLPRAAHSFCVFHMQKNVEGRYHTPLNGLLFRAAKAATAPEFNAAIARMKELHRAAGEYVEAIDKRRWARAFCPLRRYGHVTSNVAESMNWWLNDARKLDPVKLFAFFILKVNGLFERRREEYARIPDDGLPANVEKALARSVEKGGMLLVKRHNGAVFEVQKASNPCLDRTVDLAVPECSCGYFREQGIPCWHMCAAAVSVGREPRTLVVPERCLPVLRATYTGFISPVDQGLLQNDGLKPPEPIKLRGRGKESRYESATEKFHKRTVICSKCGKPGHNKRTCKVQTN